MVEGGGDPAGSRRGGVHEIIHGRSGGMLFGRSQDLFRSKKEKTGLDSYSFRCKIFKQNFVSFR